MAVRLQSEVLLGVPPEKCAVVSVVSSHADLTKNITLATAEFTIVVRNLTVDVREEVHGE